MTFDTLAPAEQPEPMDPYPPDPVPPLPEPDPIPPQPDPSPIPPIPEPQPEPIPPLPGPDPFPPLQPVTQLPTDHRRRSDSARLGQRHAHMSGRHRRPGRLRRVVGADR